MDAQPECVGGFHDGGEAGVAVGEECFTEAFAAHAGAASQFAEVAGVGDDSERLGDEGWVVAGLPDCGFEAGRGVLDGGQLVGARREDRRPRSPRSSVSPIGCDLLRCAISRSWVLSSRPQSNTIRRCPRSRW